MLNGLDLFSGIAGNTLGLRQYVKTVAYCEADKHAQSVLLSRMSDGSIERAPICTDVTKLDGNELKGIIDIIVGGFPCQDISVAGKGVGLAGKRSGLFFELCRLVEEIKPTFVFLENVPAIRTRGLREVVRSLTDLGYDCRWACVSAAEVGAPHLRKRWFLLAYSDTKRYSSKSEYNKAISEEQFRTFRSSKMLFQRTSGTVEPNTDYYSASRDYWTVEPNVGRVVDGLPLRVDRIKRLGNAVVPLQAKVAFEKLIGIARPK